MHRRVFLGAATVALASGHWQALKRSRTRLILLGTGGGPRPRRTSAGASQVIVVDDSAYVVDCGDGVARQLVLAGIPLPSLRHIFVTHQHSDHTADYGNLFWLAWTAGLRTRVDTWGPPPLTRMTTQFFAMNAADIRTRIADEKRIPLAPLIHPHDLTKGGVVLREAGVTVTAAVVHHPPVVPSFAYRFDTPDHSIVISGDTTRSDTVISLAQGADVLVHEAMLPAGVERLVPNVPNAADLRRSILSHHTTAEDAGRVAQAAGVRTLVLSHLIPAEDPQVTDSVWRQAASAHFTGTVVVGRDLLEVPMP